MNKKIENLDPFNSLVFPDRVTVSSRLYEEIKGKIISGQLPAGYMFPNEIVLSEKLKVGRTSLREAFHALSTLGLINRTKGGTFVNSRDVLVDVTPFSELLKRSNINDLMEFRIMVESEIAAIAAARATDEDIAFLKQNIEKMEEAKFDNDVNKLTKYDTEFHVRLGQSSKNILLADTMRIIRDVYEQVIFDIFQKDHTIIKRAIMYHKMILKAVIDHDVLKAREVSFKHVKDIIRSINKK